MNVISYWSLGDAPVGNINHSIQIHWINISLNLTIDISAPTTLTIELRGGY